VSFPTTGDDCDAILSLCFYNTLDEDSERKVMNERYFCTEEDAVTIKKNLKTCFNPITIETLKTKIVSFFPFVRHEKKAQKC
jgi:hypothetical protein